MATTKAKTNAPAFGRVHRPSGAARQGETARATELERPLLHATTRGDEREAAHEALEGARAFCEAILPRVSRTFALSISALSAPLREAIEAAYLLCRIVDTIEDDATIGPKLRGVLFDSFEQLMRDDASDAGEFESACLSASLGGRGKPDHELCSRASAVFLAFRALSPERRAALRPHILEMSRGMREFSLRADSAGKLRLTDLAELERYCYFVAGTVGKLLTGLFAIEVPSLSTRTLSEARARAVSFGVALQLVNIVKDVAEDYTRGDCFLPMSLAEERGLSLDDLFAEHHRDAGLAVVQEVCARARLHLQRAKEYTLLWPSDSAGEVRLFCAVPLALAVATLDEVERGHDTLVMGRTPKIPRDTVWGIFEDAQRCVDSNDALSTLLDAIGSRAGNAVDSIVTATAEREGTASA